MSSLTRCILFLFIFLQTRDDQLQATDVISTLTGSGWIRAELNSGTDQTSDWVPAAVQEADGPSAPRPRGRLPNQSS